MNTACGRLVDDVVIGEDGLKLMSLIPKLNAKEQDLLLTLAERCEKGLMTDAERLEIELCTRQSDYDIESDDQSNLGTILPLYFPNGIQPKEYMWVGYLTRMHSKLMREVTDWSFDEGEEDLGSPAHAAVAEAQCDHRTLDSNFRHDTIPSGPPIPAHFGGDEEEGEGWNTPYSDDAPSCPSSKRWSVAGTEEDPLRLLRMYQARYGIVTEGR